MWFLLLVPIFLISIFWFFYIRPLSYWKKIGVPQSDNAWAFFGDSWRFMTFLNGNDALPKYSTWMNKQAKPKGYFGTYDFDLLTLCVTDPDLIKTIGVKDFQYFSDHHVIAVDEQVDPIWAKSLFNLTGQEWKDMRTIVSPTFTSNKLKMLFELVLEATDQFVNRLNLNEEINEVNMKDIFSRFTNDLIALTAFGVKVDSLKARENLFYQAGREMVDFSGFIATLKLLTLRFAPQIIKIFNIPLLKRRAVEYFANAIEETIKQRKEHNIKRPDIIDTYLEIMGEQEKGMSKLHRKITVNDILGTSSLFYIAGYDTVSTTATFTGYELAVNKDVQDKLRKEILETAKKHPKITYEAIQEMPYLDMVISESMRKWPNISLLDRKVVKPYTLQMKDGLSLHLDERHRIVVPIYGIHHDSDVYPNPEKFDPERFSKENRDKITPYNYLPFGIGPRICIGSRFALMELKTLFYNLLLKYELVPIEKTCQPPKVDSFIISYELEKGGWVGLKPLKT